MDKLKLGISNIHLIGAGGSGMFPIEQILSNLGYLLSGSDVEESSTLEKAKNLGMKIYIGQTPDNLAGAQLVIYSAAISKDNVELVKAKQSGIKVISRAEFLGFLSNKYKQSICIAGTHGKTTTSAVLTQILLKANIDTGAVIGGFLPSINGYGRVGNFDKLVCEACEFSDTFLHLNSNISIILNIDNDHLEYFGSLKNLIASFQQFCNQTKSLVIYNGDDKNTNSAILGVTIPKISFGLNRNNEYLAKNIKEIGFNNLQYELFHREKKLANIVCRIPGKHNVYNLLAASVAAISVGVSPDKLQEAIASFGGVARRFDFLYRSSKLAIVDDYAHHPTEIRATLVTAKQAGYKNVWVIFQPFTYSRTAALLKDFADVLNLADHCIITDIMGGRETNKWGVSSLDLVNLVPNGKYIQNFEEITDYVLNQVPPQTLILTLGCGNIYKVAKQIAEKQNKAFLLN